jgi:sortase A
MVAIVVAALLVIGVAGAVVAIDLDSAPNTVASFNADSAKTTTTTTPTTTSTSTTTTTSTSTTTTSSLALQMTQPIAPPSDQRGAENNPQLGRIAIPKIGLDSELHEGIRLTTLDRGPGHWPGSAMPGQIGNVVVAGHRTSHGAEFRHLDALAPGDEVVFSTADGTFTYHVTGTQIVTPDSLWIVDPTDTPTATLFACHPLGSTAKRIVVNLALST